MISAGVWLIEEKAVLVVWSGPAGGGIYATIRQHGDVVTTEKTTEKILSLILENPNITTEELARVCDMTPDGVYYHTKRLREKGVLIREGGRKEGHWVVVKKRLRN